MDQNYKITTSYRPPWARWLGARFFIPTQEWYGYYHGKEGYFGTYGDTEQDVKTEVMSQIEDRY